MFDSSKLRDPRKEKFWRAMPARRKQSGLSIREFCRQHELKESAYFYWQRELSPRDAVSSPTSKFAPVRVTTDPSAGGIAQPERRGAGLEIVLPGDRRLVLNGNVDGPWLAEVVSVLEALPARRPGPSAPKDGRQSAELKASELAMLLEGIDLKSVKRGKRLTMNRVTSG